MESVRRVSVAPVLCPWLEIKQGSQDWTHGKIFFIRHGWRDERFRLDASPLRGGVFLVHLPGVIAPPIFFTVENQNNGYESKQVKKVTPGSEPLFGFALVFVGSRAVV